MKDEKSHLESETTMTAEFLLGSLDWRRFTQLSLVKSHVIGPERWVGHGEMSKRFRRALLNHVATVPDARHEMLQKLQHVRIEFVIREVQRKEVRRDSGEAWLRIVVERRLERIELIVCILTCDLLRSRVHEPISRLRIQ